jgi:hypothetical protein
VVIHHLIQDDEDDTPDNTTRSEGIEVTSIQRRSGQVDRQCGQQGAAAKGHQERDDAIGRAPEPSSYRAQRQGTRADDPDQERFGEGFQYAVLR